MNALSLECPPAPKKQQQKAVFSETSPIVPRVLFPTRPSLECPPAPKKQQKKLAVSSDIVPRVLFPPSTVVVMEE